MSVASKRKSSPVPPADEKSAKNPRRSSTRASAPKTSMDEDFLADSSGANDLQKQQQKERAYWSQFETPLLAAWLVDYDECKRSFADLVALREDCIDLLVSSSWVRRPEETKHISILQSVWLQHRESTSSSITLPGRIVDIVPPPPPPPAKDDDQQAEDIDADMLEETKESDAVNLAPNFAAAATSTPQPKKQVHVPAPPLRQSFSLVNSAGNPNNNRPFLAPPAPMVYIDCRTCCEPNPKGKPSWVCSCGLRGDLATDDPTNAHLARCRLVELQQKAALEQARAQAAISKSSNDSSSSEANSVVAGAAVEALDRLYEKELKAGTPYPLFTGPAAHTQIAAADALTRSREAAYNGLAYHPPSDQLIALVQSGKFWKIGHAIPRPLVYDNGDDGSTTLVKSGTSIVAKSKVPPPPTQCDSVSSFAEAFFGTIGPALIDRPEALLNWMTVGRTALEISRTHPWKEAANYLSQHLSHATAQRKPIMKTNQQIIASIPPAFRQAAAAQHAPNRPGQQPQQQNSQQPQRSNYCYDFNQERCERQQCNRPHVCMACGGAHPGVKCPSKPIQRTPARQNQQTSGGSRVFDDVSSVRSKSSATKPAKSTAPAKAE
jgi:hypothetical protein